MIVLGLDTSLDACSVAVVSRGELLASFQESMSKGQAERLAPLVRDAISAAGVSFSDIDRIAVTTGPGSFTGVRVGLSFARALALALNRPCIGVSSLEALALEGGSDGFRAALIETPGAAYFAVYENGAPLIAPRAIERGEHDAQLRAIVADARQARMRGPGERIDVAALATRAAALDPAAFPPNPAYLRAPHVTPPGGRT